MTFQFDTLAPERFLKNMSHYPSHQLAVRPLSVTKSEGHDFVTTNIVDWEEIAWYSAWGVRLPDPRGAPRDAIE